MNDREWLDRDLYADLGVSPDVSDTEIKNAYRRLARKYHPDANPGDAAAEERFKSISQAYGVLSDPDERARYDQVRRAGGGAAATAGRRAGDPTSAFDFNDLFGDATDVRSLFDRMFAAATSTSRATPRRGADLESEVVVDFRAAVRGGALPVRFTGDSEARTRQVRIPAGVTSGQRIRLPGEGQPGHRNAPPGDLYVRIRVRPDPVFGRIGNDLTLTLPVTVPELVLGTRITVPTVDGSVSVRVPADSRPGRTLRVRGRGVPGVRASGNLLVTLEAALPERHNRAARKALRAYAEAIEDFDPRAVLRGEDRAA